MHQEVVKTIAKAEFMLGIAALVAQMTGTPDGSELIVEMSAAIANLRACLQSAESGAAADQWGVTVPSREPLDTACNLFAHQYPRMVETIRLIGGSDLAGPPADRERAALYRLAWDATGSAFAKNQMEFERAALGNSTRMATDALDATDLTPLTQRIKDFLARTD
jgi:4-hydroxyphenylacetate 3-monooxygenase